jgi:hypothetical protein
MRQAAFTVAVVLVLIGCEPSGKAVIDKNRAAVEARIKVIEEFAAKVSDGMAEQTALTLPAGVKLKRKKDGQPGNVIDIALEEAQRSKVSLDYVHGGTDLLLARQHLKGDGEYKGSYVQSTVDCLLKPRFLVIVKNTSLTLPEFILGDDKHFKPGSVEFEVYAYDMQENKELGMVKGSAKSSATVLARTDHGSNTDQDLKYSMELNAGVAYGSLMDPFEEGN